MADLRQGLKPPAAVDEPQDPSRLTVVDEEASVSSLVARWLPKDAPTAVRRSERSSRRTSSTFPRSGPSVPPRVTLSCEGPAVKVRL